MEKQIEFSREKRKSRKGERILEEHEAGMAKREIQDIIDKGLWDEKQRGTMKKRRSKRDIG